MRESILNAMSPFGRKSHSRKASGAAVVGGGVRFFSHAQQQQPALYFLFFSISPTHCINDFSLCVVFFVSRSANRKFSAGAGGFQCCRKVWGVYKHLDRAAVAALYPPFVEHFFTKKEILPCSFFRFPFALYPALICVCHHVPYKFSGLAAGKGGRIGAHVPQRCLRLPMCACAPLKQSD